MRAAVAHGREAVVSLSQTEIMLVLATVILLLLLAKDTDLRATETALAATKGDARVLAEQAVRSPEEIAEQRQQADLAKEVKEALSRDGKGQPEGERPRLAPNDVKEIQQALAERDEYRSEKAAVDEALRRGGAADADSTREGQLERLADAAATGAALAGVLSADRAEALRAAHRRPQSAVAIRALLGDWLREDAVGDNGGDKLGFTPCWPRHDSEVPYYYAYDVHHANGRYEVQAHRDWTTPVVRDALSGPLRALRDYPGEPLAEDGMRNFGQRINATVDVLRQRGIYPQDCVLMVTLNPEATGAVGVFIRSDVGFMPITQLGTQ